MRAGQIDHERRQPGQDQRAHHNQHVKHREAPHLLPESGSAANNRQGHHHRPHHPGQHNGQQADIRCHRALLRAGIDRRGRHRLLAGGFLHHQEDAAGDRRDQHDQHNLPPGEGVAVAAHHPLRRADQRHAQAAKDHQRPGCQPHAQRRAGVELAVIADAVAVVVQLERVGDVGAVVRSVGYAVGIQIARWDNRDHGDHPQRRDQAEDQARRDQPEEGTAVASFLQVMLGQAGDPVQRQEAAEDGDVDKGDFLGGQHQGHGRRQNDQPARFAPHPLRAVQILERGIDHDQREQDGRHVVADIAAVVHQQRRDQEQQRDQQGPHPPQPAPEQGWHHHHCHTDQGRVDARREVVVPEEQVEEGVHVEQQRPMHQRRVLEVPVAVQVPGELGVQALVMAHDPHAKIGESGDDRQDEQHRISDHFPIHGVGILQNVIQGVRIAISRFGFQGRYSSQNLDPGRKGPQRASVAPTTGTGDGLTAGGSVGSARRAATAVGETTTAIAGASVLLCVAVATIIYGAGCSGA